MAETDIFGDGRNFSAYFGDELAVAEVGCTPLKGLDWGLRYVADFEDVTDKHLQVKDHYLGLFVKYPFMTFDSLFPELPIKGEAFAGVSPIVKIGTDNVYILPEIGVDIEANENIDGRLSVQYSKRTDLFDGDWQFMAGFVARWK